MKILLMNAPVFDLERYDVEYSRMRGYSLYPPVSLTTIASNVLRKNKNVEVEVLDTELEIMKYYATNTLIQSKIKTIKLLEEVVIEKIKTFKPNILGISVVFSISNSNALSIAEYVKKYDNNICVVCGGNHATFAYKQMLNKCHSLDFVFLYEADETFPLFIDYKQGKIGFTDLRGIAYLDKATNEIKLTACQGVVKNIDQLPIPCWDLVPLSKYQQYGRIGSINSFGDENLPTYIMQTSRGCMGGCTFCTVRNFYGKGVRAYSAERVLAEIDYLYNDLGITQLEMLDDDFTFDRNRTLEICEGLIKRKYKMTWNILNGIRLGTITDEVMDKLVRSGCRLISVGIESGNDSTLKRVHKPLSIKMLYEKTKIIKKYPELYVKANYIVGFPFETKEEMMNTYRVAEELKYDWNVFSVFTPLPGTSMFQGSEDVEQLENYYNSIKNDTQFDVRNNDPNCLENDLTDSKIPDLAYLKNLELNFIKNINLNGDNTQRAIQDFKGIVRFIAQDHAIAHYCLAKAYRKAGDKGLADEHIAKAMEVLSDPSVGEKWKSYFQILVPKQDLSYDFGSVFD